MADDAHAVVAQFWRLMATNDFHAVGAVLADDFVLEWPQSRERIRGAARFAGMNHAYPAHGPWRFDVRRLVAAPAVDGVATVASDVEVSDGVQHGRSVGFFEVRADGRIARLLEYWPDPMEAPAWRAPFTEPMD